MESALYGPLINVGAVGVCLVVLAFYFVKKDRQYEKRIDERIAAEREYRKEQADHQEKYRLVLEKFNQTVDAVLKMMPGREES
jgi:uncharacterized protein YdaU (DUF1376 family)